MGFLIRWADRAQIPDDDWLDEPTFIRRRSHHDADVHGSIGEVHYRQPAPEPMRATMTPPDRAGYYMARVPGEHAWTVYEVFEDVEGNLWYGWATDEMYQVGDAHLEWSSRPVQEIPR